MNDVFIIEPHADDFLISMGQATAHYYGGNYNVHLLTMTRGGSGGVLDDLAGDVVCSSHGYRHNPAKEGYTAPAEADFGDLRLAESRAALGAIAGAVTGTGTVDHACGNLSDGFGGPAGGPPTAAGIAAAQAVIKQYVDTYANGTTFFHTMSPTDNHPDHAACGQALRNLKNDPAYSAIVSGSRFFVSRLYWADADVIAEGTTTFPATASRKAEYDKACRVAAKAYAAWQPPKTLAVGYHQVINQMYTNGLDTQGNWTPSNSVVIENRWHD